jgi:hypothetical protein
MRFFTCILKQYLLILLACMFLGAGPVYGADAFQYWSRYSAKVWKTEKIDYVSYWEMRLFENAGRLGLWYTSQQFKVHPWPFLDTGIHYTYLESDVTGSLVGRGEVQEQHRLELELNPKIPLGEDFVLSNRNRIEFRWIESQGSDNTRYRQRWGLHWNVSQLLPGINELYANNELFYLFHTQRFSEDRLIPLGILIGPLGGCTLDVFYMVQSSRTFGPWKARQVLGTQISISF